MSPDPSAPHRSLGNYLAYLSRLTLPEGEFDPRGEWEQTYDVFPIYAALHLTGRASSLRHKGELRIKRMPLDDGGAFQLDVSSDVTFLQFGHHPTEAQRTTAVIRCAADELSTPLSWELTSVALSKDAREPMPLSDMEEAGALHEGVVKLTFPGGSRELQVSEKVTSNWSLFEALQRLAPGEVPGTEFDMLEDLRVPRRRQRLAVDGWTEVETDAGTVRLYGIHQIGEGILPIHYWLDEEGRLLLALGLMRAYIWQGAPEELPSEE
ncbi:MAG: hypothetical protein ACYS8K_08370 [Planctomycetota bacterium]